MKQQHLVCWAIGFVTATFLVAACTEKLVNKDLLQGKWEIAAAESNGTPATDRLKGIYFDFRQDSVTTNFNAEATVEHVKYKATSEKINIQTADPLHLEVIEQRDTLLELATAMRGIEFKLSLRKSNE